ncbi:MAG: zinc transport system ATP-binding protein [Verrucomicrobiales bacterium]|jgi:zinc transport system ATP-binding protein
MISFHDVTFSYGGPAVIEAATFEIGKRDSICVVGPNGGGKSTLLRLVLGLEKPDSGSIEVFGKPPKEARSQIGYMPQYLNFDPQFPISVLDVALMGRIASGGLGPYRKSDREAALRALDDVGMADRASRPFSDLSGGQRQRVLIARALACDPDLLLLDEPTANVDQAVEAQLLDTLQTLSKRLSILLVSHNLGFVSALVDHVLCVNRSVHIHPTTKMTGHTLAELFGGEVAVVRHDQSCPDGDHVHHHG